MAKLSIPTAEVFNPFLENREARFHAAYGGRGGMKSHYFAGALVEEHLSNRGFRSVCIREIQKTLSTSSKQLIEDKLRQFRLTKAGQGFKIFNECIETPFDGLIIFQGMQDHNADSIKSLEGFDLAWIEEAQTITERSLNMLRPTIRKENSRIWAGWNPRRKVDAVDKFFRGAGLPTGAVVIKTGWQNNPWWTKELEQERLDDLRLNPEQYEHIWEGGYVSVATGAYFAKVLAAAKQDKRIGRVGADPLMKFYAFWDIGGTGNKADACAIWIAQFIGKEIRIVNYYEAVGQELATHVNWLRDNGYGKALCVLPHDGAQHDKVYRVSYESSLKQAGFAAHIVKNQGLGAANQRIEAVRRIFNQCWFDAQKCSGGIDALGWYHEKRDETRNIGLGAEHDWSSHACDAFGLLAVAYEKLLKPRDTLRPNVVPSKPADSVAGY